MWTLEIHGWTLEIHGRDGGGLTQSYANLKDADMMVRDYLNVQYEDDRGTHARIAFTLVTSPPDI